MAKKLDLSLFLKNQGDAFIIIAVALVAIIALLFLNNSSSVVQIYYCTSDATGNTMSIEQAINLMDNSECSDSTMKMDYVCNSITGTWWIDINAPNTPAGCNPACVVNIDTGEAVINWRCTGLIN